jgi:hypothetical protein
MSASTAPAAAETGGAVAAGEGPAAAIVGAAAVLAARDVVGDGVAVRAGVGRIEVAVGPVGLGSAEAVGLGAPDAMCTATTATTTTTAVAASATQVRRSARSRD